MEVLCTTAARTTVNGRCFYHTTTATGSATGSQGAIVRVRSSARLLGDKAHVRNERVS